MPTGFAKDTFLRGTKGFLRLVRGSTENEAQGGALPLSGEESRDGPKLAEEGATTGLGTCDGDEALGLPPQPPPFYGVPLDLIDDNVLPSLRWLRGLPLSSRFWFSLCSQQATKLSTLCRAIFALF